MDAETAWKLFLCTGLPEVYTVYCRLKEEEHQAKSA